jgi:membrane protein DedA with SNARE-associated domain
LGAGLALNWSWPVAAGVAPLLVALAPCAAMCALGLWCGVPPWRFAAFNMLGAALWAPLVGGLGYLFGDALGLLNVDLKRYEGLVLTLIVAVAVVFAFLRRWGPRKRC